MEKAEMLGWLREKRDVIVVVLVIFVVLFSIVVGLRMQKNNTIRQHIEEEKSRTPEKVRLTSSEQEVANKEVTERKATASFFLKPSPDEVLSLIKELGDAELPVSNQKYTGLRVMWPVYFFQVLEQDPGRATVLLDVSEDGFGVTIKTTVDLSLFPEIVATERGTKIWVAGEIMGVDASGTGTIHMLTEEVRYQEGLMEAIKGTGQAPPAEPAVPAVSVGESMPVEEKRQ